MYRKPVQTEMRQSPKTTTIGSSADKQLLTEFLSGEYCIQGVSSKLFLSKVLDMIVQFIQLIQCLS